MVFVHGAGIIAGSPQGAYCLSQIIVMLIGTPSPFTPFVVWVVTLPSLDTTVLVVKMVLPAFFEVDVTVFASTRFAATVSAPNRCVPEIGESLPSKLSVMLYEIGLPSAAIPSRVTVSPLPCATMVRVSLLGGWTPVNLDFATFNFHVPTLGFSWASRTPEATRERARKASSLFIFSLLRFLGAITSGSDRRILRLPAYGAQQDKVKRR